MRLITALLILNLAGCDDQSAADAGVDSCMATCVPHLTVWIAGLEAGHVYDLSVETAAESISCSIDTTAGLSIDCGDYSYFSSHIEEANLQLAGNPESVTVELVLGEEVLADETITPEYQEQNVCGNLCDVGEVTVND